MGGGSYNVLAARSRSVGYLAQSREEVFKNSHIDKEMDIRVKPIRESRDSEEHPESYPIIIGLDVTGSMGFVPEYLVKEAFPTIIEKIMEAGIPDPQVCFMAFGDQRYDIYPIQVGEFESSDELMEKWLTKIYIEQGGGGDGAETPALVWYTALKKVVTDSWEKRGKKGVIITISDEANHLELVRIPQIFRDDVEGRVLTSDILDEVREKWNVFHINYKAGYKGSSEKTKNYWTKTLDCNLVNTEHREGHDIVDIIPDLVIKSYKGNSNVEAGD